MTESEAREILIAEAMASMQALLLGRMIEMQVGWEQLESRARMDTDAVYKALSPSGTGSIVTYAAIAHALGCRIEVDLVELPAGMGDGE